MVKYRDGKETEKQKLESAGNVLWRRLGGDGGCFPADGGALPEVCEELPSCGKGEAEARNQVRTRCVLWRYRLRCVSLGEETSFAPGQLDA